MKRFFALLFALFSVGLYAQVIGGFQYYNDGHIYFQAQNQSGYVFNVTVYAVSSDRRNSEVATLGPGGGFYIGPTTPWRWFWKEGDRLTIVYPNGQSVYWVCPQTDPAYRYNQPLFRGKHCTGKVGCDCTGFEPITNGKVWEESICKKCGCKRRYHK